METLILALLATPLVFSLVMAFLPLLRGLCSQLTLPKLNAANLSTGSAMLLPIARPAREGRLWSGLHLLI